jgi:2-methylcitrate dehydratase PrpD
MDGTRTPVMDALVDFVRELDAASLPTAVVEAASRSITDWLGTAIRGAKEPLAASLAAVIGASGGAPQATVVGRAMRTSALFAALANGAQSHALDFDDTHLPSIVHGSAPVAPVVLALGEWHHASGADALAAFVAGFEVETRIGRILGRGLADRGWHVTGVLGHFGAAAAAGKLLGLDAGRLSHALGIAGTQAAGLEQSFGTMAKPLHPGKAAMNGLLGALLAREGFTGSTRMLDGPHGLGETFLGITDLGAATDDLGKRWEILDNSTKLYAACHLTHATIDAARALRARVKPPAQAVEAVRCHVHPLVMKVANHVDPRTPLEAKFSVAFCAALALVHGEAGEEEFAGHRLGDEALGRIMARVTPEPDATLDVTAARMTVRLADGRVLEERVEAARGTPANPAGRDEVLAKFRRLAGGVLPTDRVARLSAALADLAGLGDVADLAALAVEPSDTA